MERLGGAIRRPPRGPQRVSRRLGATARATARIVALAAGLVVAACGGGATASPGDDVAAAFVDILTDPELHASVVQQATSTADIGGDVLDSRTTMTGDLALPDARLQVVIEAEGVATRLGVIVVGDRTFVDLGEGWLESPPGSVDGAELGTAFAVVSDPNDLALAGQVVENGETLYHLVATRALPYTPAGFGAAGAGTGTIDDLDAYVLADGTPVRIEFSFTARGDAGGATTTVLGTTEIRFTDVGGEQVVVAPSLAPSPVASPSPSPTASAAPQGSAGPTPVTRGARASGAGA